MEAHKFFKTRVDSTELRHSARKKTKKQKNTIMAQKIEFKRKDTTCVPWTLQMTY